MDDTTVTLGLQNSEKENFEKIHYESLFEQEICSEEEMSYSKPGRTANETLHTTEYTGENIVCSEQSMWYDEAKEKTAFGDNLVKRIMAKNNQERIWGR